MRKAELWFSQAAACSIHLEIELGSKATASWTPCDSPPIELPTMQSELVYTLRRFTSRIESLQVEAICERDAHVFISSVYHVQDEQHMALENLTLRINPDTPSVIVASPDTSTPYPVLNLPKCIHLSCLRLVNHVLPNPTSINLNGLRSLAIIRPIRSSPLHLQTILRILRATTSLTSLEIESRLTDAVILPVEGEEEDDEEEEDPLTPLTLPSLTHLSLRSNHIPQTLSSLIMPDLHTLRLDDLDGRRQNASEETGAMLRQLLVRMDLPRETRRGNGLKVLDLTSIALQRPTSKEENVWDWCFRRMWFLEKLHVKNMNVDGLMDILLPPLDHHHADQRRGVEFRGDFVCPRLQTISIIANHPSRSVARFQRTRPSIDLKCTLVDDPLSHSYLDFMNTSPTLSSPVITTNHRGFGFGSPFDRRRNQGQSKKSDLKH